MSTGQFVMLADDSLAAAGPEGTPLATPPVYQPTRGYRNIGTAARALVCVSDLNVSYSPPSSPHRGDHVQQPRRSAAAQPKAGGPRAACIGSLWANRQAAAALRGRPCTGQVPARRAAGGDLARRAVLFAVQWFVSRPPPLMMKMLLMMEMLTMTSSNGRHEGLGVWESLALVCHSLSHSSPPSWLVLSFSLSFFHSHRGGLSRGRAGQLAQYRCGPTSSSTTPSRAPFTIRCTTTQPRRSRPRPLDPLSP